MHQTRAFFSTLKAELEEHLEKEEQIVFPLINEIGEGKTPIVEQLSFLVANMEAEHSSAGELLEKIRESCHNFEAPEQACNTFIVVLHLLEEFEADLHTHVFLENHVLFPRLIDSKVIS